MTLNRVKRSGKIIADAASIFSPLIRVPLPCTHLRLVRWAFRIGMVQVWPGFVLGKYEYALLRRAIDDARRGAARSRPAAGPASVVKLDKSLPYVDDNDSSLCVNVKLVVVGTGGRCLALRIELDRRRTANSSPIIDGAGGGIGCMSKRTRAESDARARGECVRCSDACPDNSTVCATAA
jgi:hypothetical protein